METLLSFVGVLAVTGGILYLAYFCTRRLAGHPRIAANAGRSGQMRVLDRLAVGQDRQLLVVLVGKRCFLMSSSSGGIEKIEELSAEDAALWDNAGTPPQAPSFRQVLSQGLLNNKKPGGQ